MWYKHPQASACSGMPGMDRHFGHGARRQRCCTFCSVLSSKCNIALPSVWMMTTDQELIDAWQRLCMEMMVRCGFIDVTICPLQSEVHTNILSSAASETSGGGPPPPGGGGGGVVTSSSIVPASALSCQQSLCLFSSSPRIQIPEGQS